MHGTWTTTGGSNVGGLAVAGITAVAAWFILANIVFVLLVVAGSFILTAVIVGALIRMQEHREAEFGALLASQRVLAAPENVHPTIAANESRPIEQHIHYHLHGVDLDQAAEVMRRALPQ